MNEYMNIEDKWRTNKRVSIREPSSKNNMKK